MSVPPRRHLEALLSRDRHADFDAAMTKSDRSFKALARATEVRLRPPLVSDSSPDGVDTGVMRRKALSDLVAELQGGVKAAASAEARAHTSHARRSASGLALRVLRDTDTDASAAPGRSIQRPHHSGGVARQARTSEGLRTVLLEVLARGR